MAFNVCDTEGKHLGVIYKSYTAGYKHGTGIYYDRKTMLVALTDETIEDIMLDESKIIEESAKLHKCISVFGRINEQRLKEELELKYQAQQDTVGEMSPKDFMKYLLVRDLYEFERSLPINLDTSKIEGYILLDIMNSAPKEGRIEIDFDINSLSKEKLSAQEATFEGEELKPLFAKIVNYPRLSLDVMGTGEGLLLGSLADLGGRNHTHETKLKIQSGNVELDFALPMHAYIKKGMDLKLYLKGKNVIKIFCDGIIYEM
ncbi:hypothetical protein [Desulfuribacillus alkaliarsenatis]|uniref:Uncharacterized protein n=1 Tax=Desulfuribacillus alkaliarsenatis TaxID=766136 RepID=A0A1E5FYP3_9FIRM|nr:hypothetical protein [Desulfuribacillus alkaliarsenatis]OEF95694.1 hypothetical protein BHF68_11345 [Desulfuribacillus alkaliarsenatis]